MAASASTVKVTFLGDAKQLNRVAQDVSAKTSSMGDKFKKYGKVAALGMAAAGAAVGAVGLKLFDHGAQLEAMGNKAATVFGDQIGTVKKWAKANAAGMGLTSREVMGLAANFGDLLIPMGFTRKQATKMSTDVVGLAGALSQWSGGTVTAANAADILAKAMLGERDGLKALGISITDNDVKSRLLKNGTDKLTGAALEQAKATATQQLIFEKSTDAQAAYKEGGNKLLTAQNALKSKMRELYDEAAVRLIPVFTRLSTWVVDKVIPALERMWKEHAPAVKEAFADVKRTIEENEPAIRDLLKAFGEVAKFVVTQAIPALVDLGSKVVTSLLAIRNAGYEVQKAVLTMVGGMLDSFGVVFRALARIPGPFQDNFKAAARAVDGAKAQVDALKTAIDVAAKPKTVKVNAKVIGREAARDLRKAIENIKSKTVTVTVVQTQLNNIGKVPYGKRAHGGPVLAGRPYLVGERGPEMIVPKAAGTVMDANRTAGMGGTTNYNVVIHGSLDERMDEQSIAAMLRRVEMLAGTGR